MAKRKAIVAKAEPAVPAFEVLRRGEWCAASGRVLSNGRELHYALVVDGEHGVQGIAFAGGWRAVK